MPDSRQIIDNLSRFWNLINISNLTDFKVIVANQFVTSQSCPLLVYLKFPLYELVGLPYFYMHKHSLKASASFNTQLPGSSFFKYYCLNFVYTRVSFGGIFLFVYQGAYCTCVYQSFCTHTIPAKSLVRAFFLSFSPFT